MSTPHWPCAALLLAAGCGRFGVHALGLDSGTTGSYMNPDASEVPPDGGRADAGRRTDGGVPDAGAPVVRDSGVSPAKDSGMDTFMDAAAAMDASLDSSSPTPCGGQVVFGLCWYLAAGDTSCTRECADKGGFDARATAHIGIAAQGGSLSECEQVLTALGRTGRVVEATQVSSLGIGCHEWDRELFWLSSPAFDPSAEPVSAGRSARIACACLR